MLAVRRGLRQRLRLAALPIVLVFLAGGLNAHQNNAPRLADYVGTYADAPGHTIEIADGDGLFAVVDEGKYPLRPSGVDQFTTIGGQLVSFPRDASGKVTGYEQDGQFHPRASTTITPEAAALAWPRPKGRTHRLTIATVPPPTSMTESPSATLPAPTSESPQPMPSCAPS